MSVPGFGNTLVLLAICLQTLVLRGCPWSPAPPPRSNCTVEVEKAVAQVFVNATTTSVEQPDNWLLLLIGFLIGIASITGWTRIQDGRTLRAEMSLAIAASRGEDIRS